MIIFVGRLCQPTKIDEQSPQNTNTHPIREMTSLTISVDEIFEYLLYATACISDSAQNIVFQGIAYKLEECAKVRREDLRQSMLKVDMVLEENMPEVVDVYSVCSYCKVSVPFNENSRSHICEDCINDALKSLI